MYHLCQNLERQRKPNNAINTDVHEQCFFVASLMAAGYGGRWATE